MKTKRPLIIFATLLLAAPPVWANKGLETIQSKLERRYEDLSHIDGEALAGRQSDNLVLFDVRRKEEFAVSHLKGAVQIDPNMDAATFLENYGEMLEGKTAVFYCSVGRRSSAFLNKVRDGLAEEGVEDAHNLEGGIFRWRNEDRTLWRDGASTRAVHPYNRYWGRLIEDKSAIRYTGEEGSDKKDEPVKGALSK